MMFLRKTLPTKLVDDIPLSTPIEELTFTVFDTETTGFDIAKTDRLIEIGAVQVKGYTVHEQKTFQTYVNPSRQISREITQLTEITNEHVFDAPTAQQAIEQLMNMATAENSTCLVGHYVTFDLYAFKYELKRQKLNWKQPKALDTLNLIGYIAPSYDMRDLEKYAREFGTRIYRRHSALGDALTTAYLFTELLEMCRDRGKTTWGDLLQIGSVGADTMSR
ncbi:3'-5' exonuclease [Bacillus alkalisoli]|uniref:3'-5' exonuclease n=1 Tax=Bacillus alkalisoli TaxID=2011008 RepID=UPI000C230A85|nr:3'-5' exonuclease [Bacillus alkalisoli]